jgi:ferric-dicitrate binding protein FerR (iron transport regulator)
VNALSQRICAYFDGDLTPDDQAKLRDWLLECRRHVDDFVVDCFVHTQLIELLSAHQVRANALVAAASLPEVLPPRKAHHRAGRLLALAASIAFVGVVMYLATARRSVVATITGTTDAKWASAADKRTVGSLLEAGDEIAIDGGVVRLAFARGGQVTLHGPGRIRLESDHSGQLLLGSLSAFVPEHAVGFTVRTENLKLVDLGTEFRLDRLADASCELQVYDGLVEVQFHQPAGDGTGPKKLEISQGRAIRFDAPTGDVSTIEYSKSLRLPVSAWSQ